MIQHPSKYFEAAVEAFSTLPGVGRKTATRYVLHLMKQGDEAFSEFARKLEDLNDNLGFCKRCHNLADADLCNICLTPSRDQKIICVVEDVKDIMAIEHTSYYKGLYHVLGGLISPMDGIGPSNLTIESLLTRIEKEETEEVILALSSTSEGDTTSFYIYRKLEQKTCQVSIIARGIGVGDDLEYVDEITLGRSIQSRTPYQNSLH